MRPQAEPEQATVESLAHDGRGVARLAGKTVFVDGALPGERVMLRRTRSHRRYDEAVTVEVLEAAPGRVEPRCAHFGTCGGCSLQHLDAALQLDAKQQHVAEQLARLGRVEPDRWLAPLTGPAWHYRRRARLGVKYVHKKGRVLVGFRERSSPFVADVKRCHVLAQPVGGMVEALAQMIGELSIRERLPQVEVAVGEGVTALVLRVLDAPQPADLERLRAFAAAHGVQIHLQPGGLDSVAPLEPAAAPLSYRLPEFDITIGFRPVDFIQVNAALNERIVAQTVALLDPGPGDAILDLFCGLGNFTLPLARRAGRVTGVEGDAGLVARARANAARNGLDNAVFHVADLSTAPEAGWATTGWNKALLDPPRLGAAPVLPAVTAGRPSRIVYVSCHPGSLARDAGALVHEQGYRLVAAGVMDMFPHTAHVESVAVFEPR